MHVLRAVPTKSFDRSVIEPSPMRAYYTSGTISGWEFHSVARCSLGFHALSFHALLGTTNRLQVGTKYARTHTSCTYLSRRFRARSLQTHSMHLPLPKSVHSHSTRLQPCSRPMSRRTFFPCVFYARVCMSVYTYIRTSQLRVL